jgi:hypothetical protein
MSEPAVGAPTTPAGEAEEIRALLEAHEWVFAKTMPRNPHFYTLRKAWASDEDFVRAFRWVRRNAYLEWWPSVDTGWSYGAVDLGGWHYWTMPGPLSRCVLINRKPRA